MGEEEQEEEGKLPPHTHNPRLLNDQLKKSSSYYC